MEGLIFTNFANMGQFCRYKDLTNRKNNCTQNLAKLKNLVTLFKLLRNVSQL